MDDADVANLAEKPTVTKRNWILLSVLDNAENGLDGAFHSPSDNSVSTNPNNHHGAPVWSSSKFHRFFDSSSAVDSNGDKDRRSRRPNDPVAVSSKIDGINTLNSRVTDYYRRRFGGDTSSPWPSRTPGISADPRNSSPHSFRRFSASSMFDQLTLKSKFQALQWKFRNRSPTTFGGNPAPPPSAAAGSSPAFRRKAGRLVEESFKFIDSEIDKSDLRSTPDAAKTRRQLHRSEFEIQIPANRKISLFRKQEAARRSTNLNASSVFDPEQPRLVEYSTNSGEIYAVYEKRREAHELANQRRNVQFDENIRVVERNYRNANTSECKDGGGGGGFVRHFFKTAKNKRAGDYSRKAGDGAISAYSPDSRSQPNRQNRLTSPSDLESFYSVAKSCTLPSLPDLDPSDADQHRGGRRNMQSTYPTTSSSAVENPAFVDEANNFDDLVVVDRPDAGARSTRRSTGRDSDQMNMAAFTSQETLRTSNNNLHNNIHIRPHAHPETLFGRSGIANKRPPIYDPLKNKSFYVAIFVVVVLLLLTGVGVGLTIYYD